MLTSRGGRHNVKIHLRLYYFSEAAGSSVDNETEDQDHVFIAFARVYSGTVRKGQKLYVLGPKHNPAKALQEVHLTLFMKKSQFS